MADAGGRRSLFPSERLDVCRSRDDWIFKPTFFFFFFACFWLYNQLEAGFDIGSSETSLVNSRGERNLGSGSREEEVEIKDQNQL